MKMISVNLQIPAGQLAQAVADEIASSKGRNSRASLIAAQIGMPGVTDAIEAVIAATDKVDNNHHTRGEQAALNQLYQAARSLRMAVRYARSTDKDPKQ